MNNLIVAAEKSKWYIKDPEGRLWSVPESHVHSLPEAFEGEIIKADPAGNWWSITYPPTNKIVKPYVQEKL